MLFSLIGNIQACDNKIFHHHIYEMGIPVFIPAFFSFFRKRTPNNRLSFASFFHNMGNVISHIVCHLYHIFSYSGGTKENSSHFGKYVFLYSAYYSHRNKHYNRDGYSDIAKSNSNIDGVVRGYFQPQRKKQLR